MNLNAGSWSIQPIIHFTGKLFMNKQREPDDKRFISLSESWEVEYWTKTLNVTVTELRTAIANVGIATEKVKKFLNDSNYY